MIYPSERRYPYRHRLTIKYKEGPGCPELVKARARWAIESRRSPNEKDGTIPAPYRIVELLTDGYPPSVLLFQRPTHSLQPLCDQFTRRTKIQSDEVFVAFPENFTVIHGHPRVFQEKFMR